MKSRHVILRGLVATVIGFAAFGPVVAAANAGQGFADVHVHFNWDQQEIIGAEEIVGKLRAAGVEFAVVAATPSELALELKRVGGDLIIPLFSPYTHELGRNDWYRDERTAILAEEGLSSGQYRGIGEVHFMRGFPPATDNRIFLRLLQLARSFDVPVMIHIDAGNELAFLNLCRDHPELKLMFAHAGGNLYARHIRPVIEQCANVMIEFSARDPWRFGGLTDDDRRLLPGWRELILEYPDRFMTGTDPVWKVTRTQTWDQADDGWSYFEKLLAYHRQWIAELPPPVQQKIRLDNARRFFNVR
ncbi:MAG: amidohydrolase family protein [Gammaproteobacteria bacterium]|nr:amidohydrolase family protein [Gammaproteobacteria bacterium]